MNINLRGKGIIFVPVILSLIIALIVTLINQFPLSWDIYTHINYALAYLQNGITNTDYFLNAPAGKSIGYPPLFHILLIIVSFVTGSGLVGGAKLLQIILVVVNVLTITYVASDLYDGKTGLFAGLILISSFMFTRLFLPIPETLAMIFFTLAVYMYYKATIESKGIYAIFTACLALLTLLTHFSSFVYLMILLVVLMLIQSVTLGNFDGIKYYVYVMIPIFALGFVGLIFLFLFSPDHFTQVLSGVVSIINNPFDLFMGQVAMGLERYVKCVGVLSLIFAIIGLYFSFKKKEFYFVSLWALVAFLFTNLHWFGIPVYTFRLLLYLIIPMVILGGYGLSNLLDSVKTSDKRLPIILVLALIILSVGLCIVHINDPSVTIFSANTEQSTFQIAPPTLEEQELINYFKNEEHNNKSILINNLYFGTVLSSMDEIPIHYQFDVYTNKSLSKSSSTSLNEEKIGYIVYDKKLIMNNTSDYESLDVMYVNGSFYPSYYFTKEITEDNFQNIKLPSTEKTFENNRFIVCKVY
ncbi:hypothetical protein PXD04_04900 [Methanosphaera sp. ISO3-F5]|uniref:ArnT family glycosyltransferase n=1 Tax=Methanosphaera sp. ISO3-F5 TaxID=1452353 RepID=UPI002B25B0FF|nr:hypothetical protein [Methanosphaera sp. ISO3-F5]WQH65122.1 hypothetical protein PXD04_04900 [Methanosphaera sp. ISO3-F5]